MRVGLLIAYSVGPDLEDQVAAGVHPRSEVLELAKVLNAEIIDGNNIPCSRSPLVRFASRFSLPLALAIEAWRRKAEFDVFYTGNEKVGILTAALIRFGRHRPRLVVTNHNLSNSSKALLFRLFGLRNAVDALICLNEYQADFALKRLSVRPQNIHRVQFGGNIDGRFFSSPVEPPEYDDNREKFILSVGREGRDYQTLFSALRSSPLRARIIASGISGLPRDETSIQGSGLENVEVMHKISYGDLRRAYETCAFAVIPLHNVDYPAGVTTLMEAMSMGKTVVATYSRGIEEFLEDSVTGFWIEPRNSAMLLEKLLLLWNDPLLAARMGARARESVRHRSDLTRFVKELESIITSDVAPVVQTAARLPQQQALLED